MLCHCHAAGRGWQLLMHGPPGSCPGHCRAELGSATWPTGSTSRLRVSLPEHLFFPTGKHRTTTRAPSMPSPCPPCAPSSFNIATHHDQSSNIFHYTNKHVGRSPERSRWRPRRRWCRRWWTTPRKVRDAFIAGAHRAREVVRQLTFLEQPLRGMGDFALLGDSDDDVEAGAPEDMKEYCKGCVDELLINGVILNCVKGHRARGCKRCSKKHKKCV